MKPYHNSFSDEKYKENFNIQTYNKEARHVMQENVGISIA